VDVAVGLNRAASGHQRLTGHLPAEDPLALVVRAATAEDVDLDRLEVEQAYEPVKWPFLRLRRHPAAT
jgi:hypothetical protein